FRAVEEGGVEFGAENAGCDGVDADTFAGPLDGERFCKRSDGGLAGAVSGDFVKCDEARERRNINDAPVAALEHVTADDAASAKSSGDVGLHDGVPLGIGDVDSGSAFRAAGAVDEDFGAAEFLARVGKQLLDGRFIGDVARSFEREAAHRADFFCYGADEIGASASGGDVGAGLREAFGDFETDAARAADNESGFAGEFEARIAQGSSLLCETECRLSSEIQRWWSV